MTSVRQPAVAGLFYPDDPRALRAMIADFLAAAPETGAVPKAIIAPHAGYIYSGPIAATAYARLRPARGRIARVVLLGPAHRLGFRGLALASADYFATPLGRIAVDREVLARIATLPQVRVMDTAHAQEHSLEVHLPFLQEVLGDFRLVPLVVGEATAEEVAEVLEALWDGPQTLIVVSSDLSHYHDYRTAQRLDRATSQAIEQLRPQDIGYEAACGRNPVNGLLTVARKRGLKVRTVDLRNSGDTAGARDRVVGYGAYVFE
jgi:AmmeMemoRadiSam system protein B